MRNLKHLKSYTLFENVEQDWWYTTSQEMPFSEFIEIEVEERGNYEMEDVKQWMDKYGITEDTDVLWVARKPWIAWRYTLTADKWDNAEELYKQDMANAQEIEHVPSTNGVIVEESDDGDEGFIMVLH
jgi:hypothetical protein